MKDDCLFHLKVLHIKTEKSFFLFNSKIYYTHIRHECGWIQNSINVMNFKKKYKNSNNKCKHNTCIHMFFTHKSKLLDTCRCYAKASG